MPEPWARLHQTPIGRERGITYWAEHAPRHGWYAVSFGAGRYPEQIRDHAARSADALDVLQYHWQQAHPDGVPACLECAHPKARETDSYAWLSGPMGAGPECASWWACPACGEDATCTPGAPCRECMDESTARLAEVAP